MSSITWVEPKVELIDCMGDDLMVVNTARVSFDKKVEGDSLSDRDTKLIRYLAINEHWSPFSHPKVQFRVTLPIFVARQWEKHRIGAIRGYDIYDQNEVSRRYVDDTPEFFFPKSWRARPDKSIKQGSGEDLDLRVQYRVEQTYTNAVDTCRRAYEAMLEWGVAPEQARIVLPQSMITAWIETGSLLYWARVVNLRVEGHAQKEIRDLALQVDKVMQDLFPISWAALTNGR